MIRTAVLIDGDNISPKLLKDVLAHLRHFNDPLSDDPNIIRVYVNPTKAKGWLEQNGLELAPVATGKNAADIALSLDALQLALTGGIERFIIASSDGDFAQVALRLRAFGKTVMGVGEAKAPETFRAACNQFQLVGVATVKETLNEQIAHVIDESPKKNVNLSTLAKTMKDRFGVESKDLTPKSWKRYLETQTDAFKLRGEGGGVRVQRVPSSNSPQ